MNYFGTSFPVSQAIEQASLINNYEDYKQLKKCMKSNPNNLFPPTHSFLPFWTKIIAIFVSSFGKFACFLSEGLSRKLKLIQIKAVTNGNLSQSFERDTSKQPDESLLKKGKIGGESIIRGGVSQAESLQNELALMMSNGPGAANTTKNVNATFEAIQQELMTVSSASTAITTAKLISPKGNNNNMIITTTISKNNGAGAGLGAAGNGNLVNPFDFSSNSNTYNSIVFDKNLIDKAKPLLQKHTSIDLEISNPQHLPKFKQVISSFKQKQDNLVSQSKGISQSFRKAAAIGGGLSSESELNYNSSQQLPGSYSGEFNTYIYKEQQQQRYFEEEEANDNYNSSSNILLHSFGKQQKGFSDQITSTSSPFETFVSEKEELLEKQKVEEKKRMFSPAVGQPSNGYSMNKLQRDGMKQNNGMNIVDRGETGEREQQLNVTLNNKQFDFRQFNESSRFFDRSGFNVSQQQQQQQRKNIAPSPQNNNDQFNPALSYQQMSFQQQQKGIQSRQKQGQQFQQSQQLQFQSIVSETQQNVIDRIFSPFENHLSIEEIQKLPIESQYNYNSNGEIYSREEELEEQKRFVMRNGGVGKVVSKEKVLIPEMYDDAEYLRIPSFLDIDPLETYIGSETIATNPIANHTSPFNILEPHLHSASQQQDPCSTSLLIPQDEMFFNQISPLARDLIRHSNWAQSKQSQFHIQNHPHTRQSKSRSKSSYKNQKKFDSYVNPTLPTAAMSPNFDDIMDIVSERVQTQHNFKNDYSDEDQGEYEVQEQQQFRVPAGKGPLIQQEEYIPLTRENLKKSMDEQEEINRIRINREKEEQIEIQKQKIRKQSEKITEEDKQTELENGEKSARSGINKPQVQIESGEPVRDQNIAVEIDVLNKVIEQTDQVEKAADYESHGAYNRLFNEDKHLKLNDSPEQQQVNQQEVQNENDTIRLSAIEPSNFSGMQSEQQQQKYLDQFEKLQLKQQIENILNEVEVLQATRNSGRLSAHQMEELKRILQIRLNDLLEFIRYDESGNDIFGDVSADEFLEQFPLNIQKIKGQTVAGISKIKLLFVFFQNFLPLNQEQQQSTQQQQSNQSNTFVSEMGFNFKSGQQQQSMDYSNGKPILSGKLTERFRRNREKAEEQEQEREFQARKQDAAGFTTNVNNYESKSKSPNSEKSKGSFVIAFGSKLPSANVAAATVIGSTPYSSSRSPMKMTSMINSPIGPVKQLKQPSPIRGSSINNSTVYNGKYNFGTQKSTAATPTNNPTKNQMLKNYRNNISNLNQNLQSTSQKDSTFFNQNSSKSNNSFSRENAFSIAVPQSTNSARKNNQYNSFSGGISNTSGQRSTKNTIESSASGQSSTIKKGTSAIRTSGSETNRITSIKKNNTINLNSSNSDNKSNSLSHTRAKTLASNSGVSNLNIKPLQESPINTIKVLNSFTPRTITKQANSNNITPRQNKLTTTATQNTMKFK